MKKALLIILIILLIAGAAGLGFLKGLNKVRYGLTANYPTIKNLVQGSVTEFDSVVAVTLTKNDDEELFNYLRGGSKSDTIQFSIPYYGRFGIDLSVRNFRVFEEKGTVEVWLPAMRLLYCELKFEKLVVNGKPAAAILKYESFGTLKKEMHEYLTAKIEKNKLHQQAAKQTLAKALMFYFMPYKFDLKLYIDNQYQTLPIVPGVNQTVDEAINQMLGK